MAKSSSLLIAVMGCEARKHYMNLQDICWGSGSPVDIEWFTGPALDVPDDYAHLPLKMKEMCRYAYESGYEYIYKCDDDTYLRPERLLSSGYEAYPTMGRHTDPGDPDGPYKGGWYWGGCGYFLNRECMRLVIGSDPNDTGMNPHKAEDRWVGNILHKAGMPFRHDARFSMVHPLWGKPGPGMGRYPWHDVLKLTPTAWNDLISSAEWRGDHMADPHRLWMDSESEYDTMMKETAPWI
jgi:hypothetical protein